jgi:hypothetical protein
MEEFMNDETEFPRRARVAQLAAQQIDTRHANTRHGHCPRNGKRSRTFNSWRSMWDRIRGVSSKGKGYTALKICDQWKDFEVFLADMGERPAGCTLDRINGKEGYDPSNCRWADAYVQRHNQRPKRRLVYCSRGHLFSKHAHVRKDGSRYCKICHNAAQRARYNKNELEVRHGKVWSTTELQADFIVTGFMAPYVIVRRKADDAIGSLEFQHEPRLYFNFVEDEPTR